MKQSTTILSTSALALLLSMNISHASTATQPGDVELETTAASVGTPAAVDGALSDASSILDSDGATSAGSVVIHSDGDDDAASSAAALPEFDPRDRNHDGKVSIGERIHHFFDRDKDGDVDGHDFVLLIKSIFDRDGDGDIDGDDARQFLGEIKGALGRFVDMAGYIQHNLAAFREHEFFGMLPPKLSGPLGDLFDTVTRVSGQLADGAVIGVGYVGEIEDQLDQLEDHIKKLKKAGLNATQLHDAKAEITKVLKIAETLVDTPHSVKKVNQIYKKLAAIEPTE